MFCVKKYGAPIGKNKVCIDTGNPIMLVRKKVLENVGFW